MLAGINGSYNYYRNSSVLQEKEGTESTQDLKEEDSKVRDNKNEYGRMPVPKDQYIKNSEEEKEPAGLYYLGKDENGKGYKYFSVFCYSLYCLLYKILFHNSFYYPIFDFKEKWHFRL